MKGAPYRPILCRLVDDLDFQALSCDAKLLWYTLRVSPECGPVGIFRFYPGQFIERTGLSKTAFDDAQDELEDARYITLERGHVYIRNAMRFEPTYRPLDDAKHRANLYAFLEPLSRLAIARRVLEDNGLPVPDHWPVPGATKALARPIEGPSKPLASPEPEPEPEPECKRERRARVSTPTPPAILAFRDAAHRFPPKAGWDQIVQAVGDRIDPWRDLIREWVLRGYNPANLAGILEAWKRGGLEPRAGPQAQGKAREPKAHRVIREYLEHKHGGRIDGDGSRGGDRLELPGSGIPELEPGPDEPASLRGGSP